MALTDSNQTPDAHVRTRTAPPEIHAVPDPSRDPHSARARAISPEDPELQEDTPEKKSNFLQPHLAGIAAGTASGWLAMTSPSTLAEAAAGIRPGGEEEGNRLLLTLGGLARFAFLLVLYPLSIMVGTRQRAGAVALALIALTSVHLIASALS